LFGGNVRNLQSHDVHLNLIRNTSVPFYTCAMPSTGSRKPSLPLTSATIRSRARKAGEQTQHHISTNLSAHPRTDPISAFNVLFKLFASLPGRVGGCKYKFTPAEHTLSLHLLSIVEPYTFHGVRALDASSPKITRVSGLVYQPTEILDAIMSHVDTKRDLLHVGLCCKQLHSIVFPRHFEYRLIRCKVSSISVWSHLVIHKSLARNVRRLEILDERCLSSGSNGGRNDPNNGMVIPKGVLEGDTDLESTDDELGMHNKQERYFAAALMRMTGLREFKWACNHSPISVQHIWPVLMARCVTLQMVEICDNLIFASQVDGNNNSDSGSEGEVATVSRPKRKAHAAVRVI
jgi:hypothetical protein